MFNRVYLAKNLITGELVFIGLGERYDQKVYQLMWSIDPDDFLTMFNHYHAPAVTEEKSFPIKEGFGDLITRAEYEEFGYIYDSCYASNGKVYWDIDPEFKECSHVLCLSK